MGYKTMQGRTIDMEKLMRQHELTPAVGNAKVNARGDKLGPGGKIVQKREDMIAEYYETNPKAARPAPAPVEQPAPAAPAATVTTKTKKSQTEE